MALTVTKNKTRVFPENEEEILSEGLVKVINDHLSIISKIWIVLNINLI